MATIIKKRLLKDLIRERLDGRPNRWLAERCNIHESEISRILTGRLTPTQGQLDKINTALTTDFTLNG